MAPHRPLGLPRTARLRKRREFLAVQRRGPRVHGRFVIAIAARGKSTGARMGVTASKKVGNAVQRNRAKRLVREAFRHLYAELPPWLDVVVVARRAILEVGLAQVNANLESCLQRAVQDVQAESKRRRPQRS